MKRIWFYIYVGVVSLFLIVLVVSCHDSPLSVLLVSICLFFVLYYFFVLGMQGFRPFLSVEQFYRDLRYRPMSDEEFCAYSLFQNAEIPKESVIALRHYLADHFDLPVEKVRPEVRFLEIPIKPSYFVTEDILLNDIEERGGDPSAIGRGSVAELVIDLYNVFHQKEPIDVAGKEVQF